MKALIDGDLICYRIGFACQSKAGVEPFQAASEGIVRHRVDEFLTDILTIGLTVDDYEGYLTLDSEKNFRNQIAVTAPYKGNRDAPKPVHHEFIRQYLLKEWKFNGIIGQEADDSLAQEQTELGLGSVIVSIDKDMLQVPGFHYNFRNHVFTRIDEEEGFYNFCMQMLQGDRIDNIIGIKGYGPVKAKKCLANIKGQWSKQLLLNKVAEVYKETGDKELKHFKENARLLWLRRNKNGEREEIESLIEELA